LLKNKQKNKWNNLDINNFFSVVKDIFPAVMVKYQSEHKYKGKKGNKCWVVPDRVLRKLIVAIVDNVEQKKKQIEMKAYNMKREDLMNIIHHFIENKLSNIGININLTDYFFPHLYPVHLIFYLFRDFHDFQTF